MSGTYTKEMHEAYRKEQDEKAKKQEEANRERTEKESARRVWLADGGRPTSRGNGPSSAMKAVAGA